MTTVREYFSKIRGILTDSLASSSEGEAAAYLIFEDVAGYSRTKLFADGDRTVSPFMQDKIRAVADRIVSGQPIQYAVGKALFMGNYYKVDPSVLIPRPETAWLVDRICDDYGKHRDLRILDVGTGSGCIAIALSRGLSFPDITAVDISNRALEIARENARTLGADVQFNILDILKATQPGAPLYDVIVSNPPYICDGERKDMDPRVAEEEPATALFVPDNNPLLFYRAIAEYGLGALEKGGRIYFEINSRFPDEICSLLKSAGYSAVEKYRDYKGNWRYVTAVR